MKLKRQLKILELIRSRDIHTQEDLATALREAGIAVTQATVSRDIKELNLVKLTTPEGGYRYGTAQDVSAAGTDKMRRYFRDSLLALDFSENLLVLKTLPGTAQGVGLTLDQMGWPEIVGTVAGDDTILAVVRSREAVPVVMERIRSLVR